MFIEENVLLCVGGTFEATFEVSSFCFTAETTGGWFGGDWGGDTGGLVPGSGSVGIGTGGGSTAKAGRLAYALLMVM